MAFCFCFGHSKNKMADKTSLSTEQRKQETLKVLNECPRLRHHSLDSLVQASRKKTVSVTIFIKKLNKLLTQQSI